MSNWKLGKFQYGFTETATSGGTLNLIASSKQFQVLTGTLSHIVMMPDATTLFTGCSFTVENSSTGSIIVQDNGGNLLGTVTSGSALEFFLTSIASANGVWRTYAAGTSANGGLGSTAPLTTAITPGLAVFVGGGNTANSLGDQVNTIDYVTIATNSNSTSFGTLSSAQDRGGNASSTVRGLIGGGYNGSITAAIQYISLASLSNGLSFGNLSVARRNLGGCSNATLGVFAGGYTGSAASSTIDYVTIATLGNATSFGTLTIQRTDGPAGLSSQTRGLFGGGDSTAAGAQSSVIDYVTFASVSNATSFGSLTVARFVLTGASNRTTGVFAGGTNGTFQNTMDYVTIATTGNATSFGSLIAAKFAQAACASSLRILFAGGSTSGPTLSSTIEYITIATLGNATSFGNLSTARTFASGCSNCHGGL